MVHLAFLTKDLVVLAQHNTDDGGPITFDVWSLDEGRVLYRCQWPLSAEEYRPRFLTHPASHHHGNSPTKQAKMFVPDPAVEILGIVFRSIGTDPGLPNEVFTVVLSIDLFLQKCEQLAASAESSQHGGVVPVFEWELWGPSVTRWLPHHIHGGVGVRSTFGSRMLAISVATLQHGNTWVNRFYVTMLDFNPRPILRGAEEGSKDGYRLRVFFRGEVWAWEDVSMGAALPCRVWTSKRSCPYSSLFLDGNTIAYRLVSKEKKGACASIWRIGKLTRPGRNTGTVSSRSCPARRQRKTSSQIVFCDASSISGFYPHIISVLHRAAWEWNKTKYILSSVEFSMSDE